MRDHIVEWPDGSGQYKTFSQLTLAELIDISSPEREWIVDPNTDDPRTTPQDLQDRLEIELLIRSMQDAT